MATMANSVAIRIIKWVAIEEMLENIHSTAHTTNQKNARPRHLPLPATMEFLHLQKNVNPHLFIDLFVRSFARSFICSVPSPNSPFMCSLSLCVYLLSLIDLICEWILFTEKLNKVCIPAGILRMNSKNETGNFFLQKIHSWIFTWIDLSNERTKNGRLHQPALLFVFVLPPKKYYAWLNQQKNFLVPQNPLSNYTRRFKSEQTAQLRKEETFRT